MAEEKKIATGYIGNALRSSAADHTTTFVDEVFDAERQKYQSEVNTDIEEKIVSEQERAKAAEQAIIYDVSARNNGAVFESLSALLSSPDLSTIIPTLVRHGGMSIRFIQSSDNKFVQYRLMSNEWSITVSDWQGVDDEPTAGSANLVTSGGIEYAKKDSLVGLNTEVYGNKVQLIQGVREGYIDANGIFYENNSYVLFDVSTCRGMHITMTEGTSIQYAFLKDYNTEKVSFVSGGGRVSGTLNNTEIPSDALYLYMYTGAYSTAVVPTLEISESTNPGILSFLNQKRVITGNIYISHTQISSISDVLSSIPTNIRLGHSILVFRDKDYQIHVFVFKSELPSDINWNNVSLWEELAYKDDIEGLEQKVYNIIYNSNVSPLVFNKVNESIAILKNNIVLSQDGDSIELSVKTNCPYLEGGGSNTPSGYGFALSKEEHGVGIGLSANRIAIRADDSTWILRGANTEPYYNPQKNIYVLKISYESGNILTYVDDNLVNTYTGQKTITIKSFGNGANLTYGYWDGIIYWLKVNGKQYNLPYISSMSNVEKVAEQYPNMLFEKTADSINVYRRLDGDNYIKYPILKAYKSYTEGEYPSFYDNWGLRQVSKCKFDGISTITNVETLFRDGEAECAIAVQRGAEYGVSQYPYVGGSAHGFENIKVTDNKRHFIIMADNKYIGESDIVKLKAVKNVQIKQESSLYQAYTNSNPWGDVVKKWTFDESGFYIETKIKWLRDILVYKCQQGMMCVYRHWIGNTSNTYLTNMAVKDNEYVVYNVEDGWESKSVNAPLKNVDNGCNKITEWGQEGLGFSLEIIDDNRAQSGGMNVATNDSSYNKIYFSTVNNTEVAIISSGTIYYATQKWGIYKN